MPTAEETELAGGDLTGKKQSVTFSGEGYAWFRQQIEKDLKSCPGMSSTFTSLTAGIVHMMSVHPFFQQISAWAEEAGQSWLAKIQQFLDVPSLKAFLSLAQHEGDPVALFERVLRLGLEAVAAERKDAVSVDGGVEIGRVTKVGSKKRASAPAGGKGAIEIKDPGQGGKS